VQIVRVIREPLLLRSASMRRARTIVVTKINPRFRGGFSLPAAPSLPLAKKTLQIVLDKFTWQAYTLFVHRKLGKRRLNDMNKEDILSKSRLENKGRLDERELIAYGKASRVGMLVGGLVCAVLIFAGEFLLHMPEVGFVGWLVYFAMLGADNITLWRELKDRRKLIYGAAELLFAVLFAAVLVGKAVM